MLAIVATDERNGIGKNNQLLCHLPDDLKYFKKITSHQVVIMGRKTYESIGKPLPNRINVVISKNRDFKAEGIEVYTNTSDIIQQLTHKYPDKKLIVIGGAQIYRLFYPYFQEIHRTLIHHIFEADAFFPVFEEDFVLVQQTYHPKDDTHLYDFEFQVWKRKSALKRNV